MLLNVFLDHLDFRKSSYAQLLVASKWCRLNLCASALRFQQSSTRSDAHLLLTSSFSILFFSEVLRCSFSLQTLMSYFWFVSSASCSRHLALDELLIILLSTSLYWLDVLPARMAHVHCARAFVLVSFVTPPVGSFLCSLSQQGESHWYAKAHGSCSADSPDFSPVCFSSCNCGFGVVVQLSPVRLL